MKYTSLKDISGLIDNQLDDYRSYHVYKVLENEPTLNEDYKKLKKLKNIIQNLPITQPSARFDETLKDKLSHTEFSKPSIFSSINFNFNFPKVAFATGTLGLVIGVFFASLVIFSSSNALDNSLMSADSDRAVVAKKSTHQPEVYSQPVPPSFTENSKNVGYGDNSNYNSENFLATIKCGNYMRYFLQKTRNVPKEYLDLVRGFLVQENLVLGQYYLSNNDVEKALELLSCVAQEAAPNSKEAIKAEEMLKSIDK